MCGIVFAVGDTAIDGFVHAAHVRQRHRGPDAEGFHFEKIGDKNIGFAQERLAIMDLSDKGRQPMISASGNLLIIFNGEIYNYRELSRLYGLSGLRSGTDTEVALELIERIGIDAACRAFNGMWSMIVLDRRVNRVFITRDRFGKKPLYYTQNQGAVYFASEMHSLLSVPGLDRTPDAIVAGRFLVQSLQNVDDRSWLASVKAFPAASIAEIDIGNPSAGLERFRGYWQPPSLETPARWNSEDDWVAEVRSTVADAVRLRLHADVTVGIALSGGLDSSILAAIADKVQVTQGQKTVLFSAVHPGSPHDESLFVDSMAKHLGCDVERFVLNPGSGSTLLELLQACTSHNDGPIASFSNVLFYKLMELAKARDVTVVLTGQGADEAFCGYRKYPFLEAKRLLSTGRVGDAFTLMAGFIARGTMLPELNIAEGKRYLGYANASILGPVLRDLSVSTSLTKIPSLAFRQWQDISQLSVPYLCHYEDRMSMAWSREVRAPFLDYRVVELGLRLPEKAKLARGWTKYALRLAFEELLPPEITWRKDKKGFVNPQDDWLRNSLQEQVYALMADPSARVYSFGLVERDAYLSLLKRYCNGDRRVWFREVFAPFSLEVWLQGLC